MNRSTRLIRILLHLTAPLRAFHRIRIEGLDRIPERPCVLIANHSIGAVPEVFTILYAWEKRFGFRYERPAYGLAHSLSFRTPGISTFMKKIGAIPADFASAKRALDSGASVLVFPGGNWEATRSFRRGNEVDFDGHRGWIQVAKNSRVDILPISISGSFAVNPVVGRSRWLAKVSLFESLLRIRWLPVTLGQFLWAALFFGFTVGHTSLWLTILGTFLVFCSTPLMSIWPARISIRFLEPISSDASADDLDRDVQARIKRSFD